MAGYFDFSRSEKFPTQHPSHKTPVTVDVLEAGFILTFVILATCHYVVIPSSQGRYRWRVFIRVTVSLFIGAVLMTSNFGQAWEVGQVTAVTSYRAGDSHKINASIGAMLGLRSVNITLVRLGEAENNTLKGEIINYNERFWWTWDQGRLGFGPYAGRLQQDFRQAQLRGIPLPILWVADYFTWDGEGLRFGRYYRTAGWYAHILLWAAFPCWIIANLLFLSVIRYGAYFTVLVGGLQLLSCVLWVIIRNPVPLDIPFDEDEVLQLKYGINFWLTLSTGLMCVILGAVIIFLNLRYPDEIAEFFGIDPLADYEEYHLTADELANVQQRNKHRSVDMLEMGVPSNEQLQSDTQFVLKRRTTVRSVQKALIRVPQVLTEQKEEDDDDEMPLYDNVLRPGYSQGVADINSGTHLNVHY